jgi:hypothetical protein
MKLVMVEDNPTYKFLSKSGVQAAKTYGIKSISLLAIKN